MRRRLGASARGRAHLTLIASILAVLFLAALPRTARAESGYATWYGPGFQGNPMYGGSIYNMYDPTIAACNIYPLGTWVEVTNPANGRSVIVQVRDRGGFSYAFDLSYAAFKDLADPAVMGIPIEYHVVSGPNGDPARAPTPASSRAAPGPAHAVTAGGAYTVQPGDTLNGIAAQLGVAARSIMAWNGLNDPNLLVVGESIRVSPPAKPKAAPSGATYVVQVGDTLFSIARRYGTTTDQLQALNTLSDPDSIAPGQTIAVPASTPAPRTYVVQPGDTLTGIASAHGLTGASLAAANHLDNPDAIQPGTTLLLPP